jgi:hypothetical protein
MSLGDTVAVLLRTPPQQMDLYCRPQHLFVAPAGRPLVRCVGLLEDLPALLGQLAGRTGARLEPLHENSARPFETPDAFRDRALVARVQQIYQRDFELFGYPREP